MAKFLLGVVVGALGALGVTMLLRSEPIDGENADVVITHHEAPPHEGAGIRDSRKVDRQPILEVAPARATSDRDHGDASDALLGLGPSATNPTETDAQEMELPENEFVLKAGEGILLDSLQAIGRDRAGQADVVVNEIWIGQGANLGTRHGGVTIKPPMRARAIELVDYAPYLEKISAAPVQMRAPSVHVQRKANRITTGLAFAKSGSGRTYRLRVLSASSEPVVVDRTVHLEVVNVVQRSGPAEPILPEAEYLAPESELGSTFSSSMTLLQSEHLGGSTAHKARTFRRSARVADDIKSSFRLRHMASVVFRETPRVSVETNAHSAITVLADVGKETSFSLGHHSTMYLRGDLHGNVKVRDHSILVVKGNVYGQVSVEFHGMVILYGNIVGSIDVGSHAKIVLATSTTKFPSLKNAAHATVYVSQRVERGQLSEFFPNKASFITLHIPESDLEEGTHEGHHGFKQVIVGAPIWQELTR